VSGLDGYYNWAQIKESGAVYCDLVVVQRGHVSKTTLKAEL